MLRMKQKLHKPCDFVVASLPLCVVPESTNLTENALKVAPRPNVSVEKL